MTIINSNSGFTNYVTSCSNAHTSDADFGNNFGCWGPWAGFNDDYYQFALSEFQPPLPLFSPCPFYWVLLIDH